MFDVTSAQIHLAVNHLPVFATLLATALLGIAAVTRRASARTLGQGMLVFAALSGLPAYLSGEGAEEIVEHRPGVSETLIERHEEAATQALVVAMAAGLVATAALIATRVGRERAVRILFAVTLLFALGATGLMARAAHFGGQIRHDELRSPSASGDSGARVVQSAAVVQR